MQDFVFWMVSTDVIPNIILAARFPKPSSHFFACVEHVHVQTKEQYVGTWITVDRYISKEAFI
jgi:hypothetical protein